MERLKEDTENMEIINQFIVEGNAIQTSQDR